MKAKEAMFETGEGIDWATAEALAFGTLLKEGVHVRLSGQVQITPRSLSLLPPSLSISISLALALALAFFLALSSSSPPPPLSLPPVPARRAAPLPCPCALHFPRAALLP